MAAGYQLAFTSNQVYKEASNQELENHPPVMRLPAELRLMIFREVWGLNKPDLLPVFFDWQHVYYGPRLWTLATGWTAFPKRLTNIIAVCRLWYSEASQLFYHVSHFALGISYYSSFLDSVFDLTRGLVEFAHQIGRRNANFVTSLAINVPSYNLCGGDMDPPAVEPTLRSFLRKVKLWAGAFPCLERFGLICLYNKMDEITITPGQVLLQGAQQARFLQDLLVVVEFKRHGRAIWHLQQLWPHSIYRLVWRENSVIAELDPVSLPSLRRSLSC